MWRDCPFWIVNYLSNNRLYAVTNIAGQEIINHNVPPSGPNRVKSKYNYHHDVGVLWNLSKVSSHNSFYISYIVPIVFFGLVRLYVLELGYIFVDLFCFFLRYSCGDNSALTSTAHFEMITIAGNCYDKQQYGDYFLYCPYAYRLPNGSILAKDLAAE